MQEPVNKGWFFLGPMALLGMLVEQPFVWIHRKLGTRKKLTTWYCILTLWIGVPVKADFLGFDLVPLAGSLLADIRSFYLEYQDQIMTIKKMAVAYYAIRQLDLRRLKDDLGDLAELELTEAAKGWINHRVTGYVDGLIQSGQDRVSGSGPASHNGEMRKGLKFRVDDPDGGVRYLTNSQIFNELFNPYDPNWDPVVTTETYFVLMARNRWLRREINRYQRAIYNWEKLAGLYNNLYLDDLETATIAQAVKWAISSSPELDRVAAHLQSMDSGPLAQFIKNRLTYWKARVEEVKIERNMIQEAIWEMREGMTYMEKRALGKVAATIKLKTLKKWNYVLPSVGTDSRKRFEPVPHHHWSLFPKGWR